MTKCNETCLKQNHKGLEIFFFIADSLHLIWVIEVWILRTPDLWEYINVFHERQIFVLPRFRLRGVSIY